MPRAGIGAPLPPLDDCQISVAFRPVAALGCSCELVHSARRTAIQAD
jgi:hypothetical protein